MGKKKIKQLEEEENLKQMQANKDEYNILKPKTIKELIAPSRNRCIKHRQSRNYI